jgi:hypothetical protein
MNNGFNPLHKRFNHFIILIFSCNFDHVYKWFLPCTLGGGGVEFMYKVHSHVYTITSCVFKIFCRMNIHNHDIYFILNSFFPLLII